MIISQAAEMRFAKFLKLTQQVVRDAHNAEEASDQAYRELFAYRTKTQDRLREILKMSEKHLSPDARYEILSILIEGTPTPGPELDAFLNRKAPTR
ncbi:hypothetical protein UFOVP122_16 [uncultured Caudovirales phage]|uniref:Uncharacterized protein n=1 Tax=uncultured Caudovirales phage TaxID=2100421 RepID=A0A6J5L817_9CAUD|nr:hypothetical protein UFOVP122_16 [uncultured Caudovirales phage]